MCIRIEFLFEGALNRCVLNEESLKQGVISSTACPEKGGWQNTTYLIFVYQKESVIYRPLISYL